MNHDEIIDLSHRAMRDEGLTAEECIERFGGHEIAAQIEALAAPLAFRRSVAMPAAGRRKATMLKQLSAAGRRGRLARFFANPARATLVGVVTVATLGAATVGAANPGGVRDSVGEALGLIEPEGECAAVLMDEESQLCAWGINDKGQLAQPGSEDPITEAIVSADVGDIALIEAGWSHTLALLEDGRLRSWGLDRSGQLGDGTGLPDGAEQPSPRASSSPIDVDTSSLPANTDIVALAAGGAHSLALLSDGSVFAWGADDQGQLGDDERRQLRTAPVRVAGIESAVAIAAGLSHSLAVLDDGSVLAWGWNSLGQTGNGERTEYEPVPVRVSGIERAVAVAAGVRHSLALLADGTVLAWGTKISGALGDGEIPATDLVEEGISEDAIERTPVQVLNIDTATQIAAGWSHSLALLEDGSVRAWGWDELGQLGDGGALEDQPAPAQVENLLDVVSIDAGARHSVALLRDGSARVWGQNYSGLLGAGVEGDQPTPVRVGELRGATAISAGDSFTLALRIDAGEDSAGVAITKGDWIEIVSDDGCADPSELPPSGAVETNRRLACPPDGTVLMVVGGPDEVEGQRFWALSGFGWLNERYMRFDHEGTPPYPERPELAEQGLIAYVGPDQGLWLMRADGTDNHRINRGPVFGEPLWSPDGRLIAFAGDRRLRIVDIHGAMLVDLAGYQPPETLAWSPDSTMISARTVSTDGIATNNLAVIGVDGSIILEIPSAIEPSWSADSGRLGLFLLDESQAEELFYPVRGALVDVPDGKITFLDESPEDGFYSEGPPLWRPGYADQLAYHGQILEEDGESVMRLPGPVGGWSPDGSFAVITVKDGARAISNVFLVYDIANSEELARFTVPPCQCDGPDWAAFRGGGSFSADSRYFLIPSGNELSTIEQYEVLDLQGGESLILPGDSDLIDGARRLVGASPDGEYLLHQRSTIVYPEFAPQGVSPWIWVTGLNEEDVTMLAEGIRPAWQPVALIEQAAETSIEAVERVIQYYPRTFEGLCSDDLESGLCARDLGTSGPELVYSIEDADDGRQVVLLFVRPEDDGYVVGHLEPPFCQGEQPCPPEAGATVEIAVSETCVNARSQPGRDAPINSCVADGQRAVFTGETEIVDARIWVELDGLGWVSASYILCVEGCE